MSTNYRQPILCPPLLSAARSPAWWARIGVMVLLAAALELAPTHAMATDAQTKVPRSLGNSQANPTRQALLKQRPTVLGSPARHPGKTVGGTGTPMPKTIVTKRFLPK
jgi:hypothetical protein